MSIECKTETISNLSKHIDDNLFSIPTFQRAYVWGKTQIDEMFEDFKNDSNEYDPTQIDEMDQYLMGNVGIVKEKNQNIWNIVDGQQRLTTFTMIARQLEQRLEKLIKEGNITRDKVDAGKVLKNKPGTLGIYDALELSEVKNYIPKLRKFYLADDDTPRLGYMDSPDLSKQYREYMREDAPKITKKNPNVAKLNAAWKRIGQHLDEITHDEQLEVFCKYFAEKVTLVMTLTNDWGKAYQTFEV